MEHSGINIFKFPRIFLLNCKDGKENIYLKDEGIIMVHEELEPTLTYQNVDL